MTKTNRTDPNSFVVLWNILYPFDYWWRQKYRIPFGSKEHLEANLIFMRLEWEEDKLFKDMAEDVEVAKNELEFPTQSGSKTIKLTKKQIDEEFEDFDFTQFNVEQNGGTETN